MTMTTIITMVTIMTTMTTSMGDRAGQTTGGLEGHCLFRLPVRLHM
jgi:hypothetical protein